MMSDTPRLFRLNQMQRHWFPAGMPVSKIFAGMASLLLIFTTLATTFAAPDVQTYDGLLRAIRAVQAASQKRVEQAIDREKVREAWETGKLIDAHILNHKERADYGERVLERLAADLGTGSRELRYMLEFFRTYPIVRPAAQLSWSHYEALLSINDDKARKEVADEAVRQHWNRDQVRAEVRRRHARERSTEKLPVSGPGNLYTYRVVRPAEGPYAGTLALDLGFAVTFRPRELELSQFRALTPLRKYGAVTSKEDVHSTEGDVAALRDGKLIPVTDSPGTYQAYVTEIIDGDTFHARIDLGFGITIHQKLRLRGLDAPVVESADGREAKSFLEKHLFAKGPARPILVQASKSDKYDRYLADVWVSAIETTAGGSDTQAAGGKAEYLNQLLLDEGLAVRVNE